MSNIIEDLDKAAANAARNENGAFVSMTCIAAKKEIEELQRTFDLRWKADMRAIKKWQEATGKTLTWPDHADLCVWLLNKLEEQKS